MRLFYTSPSHLLATTTVHSLLVTYLVSTVLTPARVSAGETTKHESFNGIGDLASGSVHLLEHYVPEFLGLDRTIIGRAEDDTRALGNNDPGKINIDGGESQFWRFPEQALQDSKSPATPGLPSEIRQDGIEPGEGGKATAELKRRQEQRTLYISLNVCDQPDPTRSEVSGIPDQLRLYISTSSDNQKPDANKHDHAVPVDAGFGSIKLTASSDVYISVSAPANDDFTGPYNYELTASIDDFYADYHDQPFSLFMDSDSHSALIYTEDLVGGITNSSDPAFKQWMNDPPRFSIFVQNQENPEILGMHKSMCALQNHAQIRGAADFDTSMTIAMGGQPKQQFYIPGLNASSAYYAIVAIQGNSTDAGGGVVNGGGRVWKSTNFSTQSGKIVLRTYPST